MQAIDLRQTLSPYKEGWVAINKKTNEVVAHAKTFALITQKIKATEDILLIPASKDYSGFVTIVHA